MDDMFWDGRRELMASDLNEIMAMLRDSRLIPTPPLDVYNGPGGQVCISINLEVLKEMLAINAEGEAEVDDIFDPPEPVVQELGFEWTSVQITNWDGIQYELTEVGTNTDGSFFSIGENAAIYFGVEFTGNQAVPIGTYGWMFAAPFTQDLYYFFCPSLLQVVRAISDEANEAGFYPAMLQRYVQPPQPFPGDPFIPDDPADATIPDEQGEFQDTQDIWLTVPVGMDPNLEAWMLARHVGFFEDGLAIYATGGCPTKCVGGGEVLIPTMSSSANRILTIPNSGLGISHAKRLQYVRKSQDFGSYQQLTVCPKPAKQVVIYTPPAWINDGILYMTKTLVVLNDNQLISTPMGIDSTPIDCVDQSSSLLTNQSSSASSVSSLSVSSQSASGSSSSSSKSLSSLSPGGESLSSPSSQSSSSSSKSASSASSKSSGGSSASSQSSLSSSSSSSQSSSSNPSLFKLNFAAATGGITIGSPSALSFASGITLSAWILTTDIAVKPVLTKLYAPGPFTGYSLYASTTNIHVETFTAAGVPLVSMTYSGLSSGNLYHVAFTLDIANPPNGKLYVNGILVDSDTSVNSGTMDATTRDFVIGGQSGSSDLWTGTIDAVRVYRAALLASQITELYGGGGGLGSMGSADAILQGWWKCDEGSGSTLIDSTINANYGTLVGQTYQSALILG